MTSEKAKSLALVLILTASLLFGGVLFVGSAVGQDAETERSASLHILQDSHIDSSVSTNDTGDYPLYEASGPEIRISPQNFDPDDVVDYEIDGDDGSISFDERAGLFEFDPLGQDGTYRITWLVEEEYEEQIERDNETVTETRTELVRYTALVSMDNTRIDAYDPEDIEQMRSDAENWTAWENAVLSPEVAGPDADIEVESESALNYLRIIHNPLDALTGEFTEIVLLMVMTLGGLLILALFGFYHIWATRFEKKYVHQTESLEADREDLDQRYDELVRKERQQALANKNWTDIFPSEHVASAFHRSFGETPLDGWLMLEEMMLPRTLLKDRIEAMGYAGYEAVIERDDDDDIIDVELIEPSKIDEYDGEPIKDLDEDEFEQLVDVVDWDDRVIRDFRMPEARFERDDLGTILESQNVERLLEEIDAQIGPGGDFSTRKEFLQYIIEFIEDVRRHEFTDEDGRVRPIRKTLNLWLRLAQITGDRHGFPQAEYLSQHIELILIDQDIGAEVSTYVKEVDHGKHT